MARDDEFYFAYGSNLHPIRLRERVPSAVPLGTSALAEHGLRCAKRGMDGSGKCTVVAAPETVLGVIYRVHAGDWPALDAAEGPDYERKSALFDVGGRRLTAAYYAARDMAIDDDLEPFDWYRDLVLCGARYHGLPAHYIAMLGSVSARPDPDRHRSAQMLALVAQCQGPHFGGP